MSRLCTSYGSRKGKLPRNPRGTCIRVRQPMESINDSVDETAANNALRQQRCGHQMLIINKASDCLLLTPYIYAATFCSEQTQLWQQGDWGYLDCIDGTAQPRVPLHLFRPGILESVWCGHKLTSGLTTTNCQHDRRVKGRVMAEYASATDRDRRSLKLTIPQRQSQTAHVPSMHLGIRACSYGHVTADGRLEREANIEQRWESICSHEAPNPWSARPTCMAVLEMQKR